MCWRKCILYDHCQLITKFIYEEKKMLLKCWNCNLYFHFFPHKEAREIKEAKTHTHTKNEMNAFWLQLVNNISAQKSWNEIEMNTTKTWKHELFFQMFDWMWFCHGDFGPIIQFVMYDTFFLFDSNYFRMSFSFQKCMICRPFWTKILEEICFHWIQCVGSMNICCFHSIIRLCLCECIL